MIGDLFVAGCVIGGVVNVVLFGMMCIGVRNLRKNRKTS